MFNGFRINEFTVLQLTSSDLHVLPKVGAKVVNFSPSTIIRSNKLHSPHLASSFRLLAAACNILSRTIS